MFTASSSSRDVVEKVLRLYSAHMLVQCVVLAAVNGTHIAAGRILCPLHIPLPLQC
jgi:hypothetical protein